MIALHTLSNAELLRLVDRDVELLPEPAATLVRALATRVHRDRHTDARHEQQLMYRDEDLR